MSSLFFRFIPILIALTVLAAAQRLLAQQSADPLETDLLRQWQARQTMDQHVAQALDRLLESRRKLRAELDEARRLCGKPCEAPSETTKPEN